jgi:hypothetical protein
MTMFGPLDELMGTLLETWEQRYVFHFDRAKRVAVFTREEMHAHVEETADAKLRVTCRHTPGADTVVECTPDEATGLVEAILFRENHGPVQSVTGKPVRPWWRRLFGF